MIRIKQVHFMVIARSRGTYTLSCTTPKKDSSQQSYIISMVEKMHIYIEIKAKCCFLFMIARSVVFSIFYIPHNKT